MLGEDEGPPASGPGYRNREQPLPRHTCAESSQAIYRSENSATYQCGSHRTSRLERGIDRVGRRHELLNGLVWRLHVAVHERGSEVPKAIARHDLPVWR